MCTESWMVAIGINVDNLCKFIIVDNWKIKSNLSARCWAWIEQVVFRTDGSSKTGH